MYPSSGQAEMSRTIPTAPPDADALGPNGRSGRHQGGVALMQHILGCGPSYHEAPPSRHMQSGVPASYLSIVTPSTPGGMHWDIVGSRTPEIVAVQGRGSARLRSRQRQCARGLAVSRNLARPSLSRPSPPNLGEIPAKDELDIQSHNASIPTVLARYL